MGSFPFMGVEFLSTTGELHKPLGSLNMDLCFPCTGGGLLVSRGRHGGKVSI